MANSQHPAPNTHTARVDFQPVGRRVDVAPGTTLLDAARAAGVQIVSICGGLGTCGECRVRVAAGAQLSGLTITEECEFTRAELAEGYRLACQAEVMGHVRVDIPAESLAAPQRLQLEGYTVDVPLDPVVVPADVEVEVPGLYDLRSDLTRVRAAVAALPTIDDRRRTKEDPTIVHRASFAGSGPIVKREDPATRNPQPATLDAGLAVCAQMPEQLRRWNWSVRLALRGNELVAVLPRPGEQESATASKCAPWDLLGLAVDVGTTKVAAYLIDLTTGVTLAKAGAMNPQIAYGEDVISRIAYANTHSGGRETLQRAIVSTLNGMLSELCAAAGASAEQVVEAVVVGNTAMHHLFCGLPVEQLGEAPYVPVVADAMQFRASEIGLQLAPGAYIYLPPNIAGYVGADHVAMLLSAVDEELLVGGNGPTIVAMDIGTNTEISLFHGGRVLSCSCASGPAFEGAHIRDGMRAGVGAVERVRISDGQVQVYTIEGQPAVGICGSGILDAVAEMLHAGILDERGALLSGRERVRMEDGRTAFVLVESGQTGTGRDLLVTRSDVNEIQLAKSAIRSGVEILLAEAGIEDKDIDMFVVAGAFGTYLDLESAVRIGMFPDLPRERFLQVGNAAGAGARALLVSRRHRDLARDIASRIEYVELTTHPDFAEEYVRAIGFGVMRNA